MSQPTYEFVGIGSDIINLNEIAYVEWWPTENEEVMDLKVITTGGATIRVPKAYGKAQALYNYLRSQLSRDLDLKQKED